jgi:hypothetical protein
MRSALLLLLLLSATSAVAAPAPTPKPERRREAPPPRVGFLSGHSVGWGSAPVLACVPAPPIQAPPLVQGLRPPGGK